MTAWATSLHSLAKSTGSRCRWNDRCCSAGRTPRNTDSTAEAEGAAAEAGEEEAGEEEAGEEEAGEEEAGEEEAGEEEAGEECADSTLCCAASAAYSGSTSACTCAHSASATRALAAMPRPR